MKIKGIFCLAIVLALASFTACQQTNKEQNTGTQTVGTVGADVKSSGERIGKSSKVISGEADKIKNSTTQPNILVSANNIKNETGKLDVESKSLTDTISPELTKLNGQFEDAKKENVSLKAKLTDGEQLRINILYGIASLLTLASIGLGVAGFFVPLSSLYKDAAICGVSSILLFLAIHLLELIHMYQNYILAGIGVIVSGILGYYLYNYIKSSKIAATATASSNLLSEVAVWVNNTASALEGGVIADAKAAIAKIKSIL